MEKHPHAAALERIGKKVVTGHFDLTRATYYQWTIKGVPAVHQNSLRLLALIKGVQVPEFNKEMEQ